LGKYEKSDKEFKKYDRGDKIVYWHRRMIDGAVVEKDHIRYIFDKYTGKLLDKEICWRRDLPEHLPPIISQEEAESMAEGEVLFSTLYFISPKSDIFSPIKPTPKNPCWAVRAIDDRGYQSIIVIDAVAGKNLGHGIAPPYTAFSFSGPINGGHWDDWYKSAKSWFRSMGYSCEACVDPSKDKVKSHIQSTTTAMFYEIAHGGTTSFKNAPNTWTYASNIENWIADYTKMPFTFLASCNAMCSTGSGTLSYAFRKGSTSNTATVGYCGMGGDECAECWENSLDWQDTLFKLCRYSSCTVKEAFDICQDGWPCCEDCMRFAGDSSLDIFPAISR
jgi:hypothetical protein